MINLKTAIFIIGLAFAGFALPPTLVALFSFGHPIARKLIVRAGEIGEAIARVL